MTDKRLGGRYELKDRVGGGGMAVVYKGHDLLLDRTVAIKVLRSQYGTDEDFIRRFRREAQAAARLTHPNVVSIYDVGQDEDIHYIVMEYVEGETLKDLIKREAPISIEKSVNITIQIAEALDNAHQHQIIHRDIKPHNILIGKNGRIKVTDFGIARAVTSATITQTGSVLGSVHYFSPEQAKGGLTGEKSDIYSLGVVLYEMVTGYLPFSGESPISVALKHLQEDFKDPRDINPAIPQSVENIILKSLSKDPDQRYTSAREMVKDLQTCLSIERKDEVKYKPVINHDGDDPTIIIPAIRDITQSKKKSVDINLEEENPNDEWEKPKSSRNKWIKPVVWVVVLAVLIGVGFYVVHKVQALFEVPEVKVPSVENQLLDDALQILDEQGLKAEIREEFNNEVESGYVYKQYPAKDEIIKSGTSVMITVSKGKQTTSMPDLIGQSKRAAEAILSGYKEHVFIDEYDKDVPAGVVIRQDPQAGTQIVPEDTRVVITISKGAETFEMPSLIGKTESEADSILLKNGLEKEKVNRDQSYFEAGIVFNQWPIQPGEQVSKGQKFTLYVSSGMKSDAIEYVEPVPIVLNQDQEAQISIKVTDARYNDFEMISKSIKGPNELELNLVLAPDHDATYTVYQDGVQTFTKTIHYNEVGGGD